MTSPATMRLMGLLVIVGMVAGCGPDEAATFTEDEALDLVDETGSMMIEWHSMVREVGKDSLTPRSELLDVDVSQSDPSLLYLSSARVDLEEAAWAGAMRLHFVRVGVHLWADVHREHALAAHRHARARLDLAREALSQE